MMGVNTRNMQSCVQKYNKLNKSHLVGQLLNSIHGAQTHVYKIQKTSIVTLFLTDSGTTLLTYVIFSEQPLYNLVSCIFT